MKVIIPVAGAGTKLRPHTYTQPKALIPMAGKTILSVIIDELKVWDIKEFIFIIGYLGDKIQDYITTTYPDLNCSFITQNERKGTGHAIYLAKDLVKDEELIIVYGDTICTYDIQEFLESPHSMIGVKRVEDPRLFGVAEIDEEGFVEKVTEKPLIPKSNLALVGIYRIKESRELFEALEAHLMTDNVHQGEFYLTDALQLLIDKNIKLKAFEVNSWFDCGKKETLLETNATLLRRMQINNMDTTRDFPNSVIIPPVHIGKNCKIENSIIGPNVAIGDETTVRSSIVHNSIIGSFSELQEIVLKESIIGSDAYVHGLSQSLNIGDNTDIDLG